MDTELITRSMMSSSELTLNTSFNSSPNHNLLNDSIRNQSITSPINLSNSLHLNNNQQQQQQQQHQSFSLKILNIPKDLSQREANLIFSLASDLLNIELKDSFVLVKFLNAQTCITVSKILDGKQIFGTNYPPIKTEIDDFYLNSNFNNLSLNSQISPPISNISLNNSNNQNSNSNSLDNFAKRPSIGNQRSRFLFSDPFATNQPPLTPNDVDTGKSLLLMEAQNDAREYEQLVRDPWGSNSSHSISQQQNQSISQQQNLNGSAPQTPGKNVAFDWGSNDRRRTSSAFFVPTLPNPLTNQQPQQQSQPQPPPSQPQSLQQPQQPQQQQLPQSQPQSQQQQQPIQQNRQPSIQQQQQSTGMADLSLLARVPPPANPADQNPPCNTLYVGNLPPDATEVELRSLFQPQKGFRRLSFRTKNQSTTASTNTNSHGPMCFVEFEDVAHATRALAELYGRALPRPGGSNGKGGIRLSFSKNPLGVRGPGNQRRTSTVQGFGYPNFPK